MAAELLPVSGLRRRFGDHEVLHGVSLAVGPGQAVAVVGPNGSGKSTLIQIQCVLDSQRPDGGLITLRGAPQRENDPAVRAEVAGVDDSVDFFPDLCVAEHLGLLAAVPDVPDAADVVQALLDEVGPTGRRTRLPGTLSTGQGRRLASASAFRARSARCPRGSRWANGRADRGTPSPPLAAPDRSGAVPDGRSAPRS